MRARGAAGRPFVWLVVLHRQVGHAAVLELVAEGGETEALVKGDLVGLGAQVKAVSAHGASVVHGEADETGADAAAAGMGRAPLGRAFRRGARPPPTALLLGGAAARRCELIGDLAAGRAVVDRCKVRRLGQLVDRRLENETLGVILGNYPLKGSVV